MRRRPNPGLSEPGYNDQAAALALGLNWISRFAAVIRPPPSSNVHVAVSLPYVIQAQIENNPGRNSANSEPNTGSMQ